MHIKAVIKPNTYADSMVLMALSTKVNELPFVNKAMIGMGTNLNKQVIAETGLGTPEIDAATPRDQIIVVECATEEDCDKALEAVEGLRSAGPVASGEKEYKTARAAFDADEGSSLVVISVPGEYAAREAKLALDHDKHVMIFSDNVRVEEERELKDYAHSKGLLVMGPDCGTAIINGVGLCFANAVNRGRVGIVGASGTGSQELSVQLDRLGSGVSQLIGVGGNDLSTEIGGRMMLDGLEVLDADAGTDVIILLSKPPATEVADRVIEAAKAASKPVVVCFIGAELATNEDSSVSFVSDTLAAAQRAAELAGDSSGGPEHPDLALDRDALTEDQTKIRGLFCGGTICDEVFQAIKRGGEVVQSNVAKSEADQLTGTGEAHTFIDLGSDEYTQGRPHPMIDPTLRNSEILKAAEDPRTAVVLLDFELGYGSHADPVGAAVETIRKAQQLASNAGRRLPFVAYVLGTDKDPQGKADQLQKLKDLDVAVVDAAVDLAAAGLALIK